MKARQDCSSNSGQYRLLITVGRMFHVKHPAYSFNDSDLLLLPILILGYFAAALGW